MTIPWAKSLDKTLTVLASSRNNAAKWRGSNSSIWQQRKMKLPGEAVRARLTSLMMTTTCVTRSGVSRCSTFERCYLLPRAQMANPDCLCVSSLKLALRWKFIHWNVWGLRAELHGRFLRNLSVWIIFINVSSTRAGPGVSNEILVGMGNGACIWMAPMNVMLHQSFDMSAGI